MRGEDSMKDKGNKVVVLLMGFGLFFLVIPFLFRNELGSKITADGLIGYLGAFLASIFTVYAVSWQISDNNKNIRDEQQNKEQDEQIRIKKYLTYWLDKNLNMFKNNINGNIEVEMLYQCIKIIKGGKGNVLMKTFYPMDKSYYSRNIENILKLKFGDRILKLNDKIYRIKELMYNRLNVFKIGNYQSYLVKLGRKNDRDFLKMFNGKESDDEIVKFIFNLHNTLTNIHYLFYVESLNIEQLKNSLDRLNAIVNVDRDINISFEVENNTDINRIKNYKKSLEILSNILGKLPEEIVEKLYHNEVTLQKLSEELNFEIIYLVQIESTIENLFEEIKEIKGLLVI